jgi:SAM-dependent methyltransferase
MADESDVTTGYVLRRAGGEEERRLEAQARVIDPLTERLFRAAGLESGMRVLELGSGAGDVSMLVARIVGQEGAVLGVESSAEAIATARRRVEDAGFRNVTLLEGDIRQLGSVLDQERLPFDALVGRLVLQFTPDPAHVLRGAADRVRPGGLVCFQEGDDWYTWAYPASPLWEQVRSWILAALEGAQIEQRASTRPSSPPVCQRRSCAWRPRSAAASMHPFPSGRASSPSSCP